MAILNIKAISKVLENNPSGRKVFKFAINTILYVLDQQRLIDFRTLQKAQLDWERGTLKLGDNFVEMLVGRAIGEYVINMKKEGIKADIRARRMDMRSGY